MKSLKTKLVIIFSVSMAVVLGIIGVFTTINVSNIVVPLNNSLTQQVVNARAAEIGKYLDGIQNDIKTWSERTTIRSGDLAAIKKDLVSRQETLRSDYQMVLYSDLNGDYFTSLGGTGNIKDRDYFQQILGGQSFALSNPVISKTTGDIIFVAAQAVTGNNGELEGVVAATILLNTFNEVAQSIKIGENGFAWIMDSTGLIFAHPDESIRLKLNTLNSKEEGFDGLDAIGQKMIAGESGIDQYVKNHEAVSVIYEPVPSSPGWSMAYTMYEKELMAPISNLTFAIVLIVIIGIFVNAAATFFISGRIVKPIKATAECAKALSEGNLDAPLAVKTKDETGQLAKILDSEVRGAFKNVEKAKLSQKNKRTFRRRKSISWL